MKKDVPHASHRAIVSRLKRAVGHLRSTIEMIESGRDCREIAQQLHAVDAAISNAKREFIHDHIQHCLDGSGKTMSANDALRELKELSKYLG
jgi:DNA-binding FrmR family transcriptional regulator